MLHTRSARGIPDICAAIDAVDASAGNAFIKFLGQSAPNIAGDIEAAMQQAPRLGPAGVQGQADRPALQRG